MEYLGLEKDFVIKKGEKKCDCYKIKVKLPLLNKVLEEYWTIDAYYVPLSGRVLSYQKFYALICAKNSNLKKELSKEKELKRGIPYQFK